MILFFYNLALLAALVVGAPWWLFRMATTQKYREGLGQRLGRVPEFEGQRERPLIWVHAVSVGEVLAVSRLVKTLDAVLPGYFVAISTTTRTGQELARERFGANRVFYCPLDLPWAVGAYLNALAPRMLVLAETEFWPNLLSGCFRREIPVAVVNARISDRSWPRYRRLRALWRPFLERIDCVLAQSETDDQRLIEIGCDPDRVSVAGNLKFDIRAAWEADATRILKALRLGNRVVVAGSTLEGEEAALLEAWPKLLEADPKLVMVVAPRHPERFDGVATLLEESGFSWKRRTEWLNQRAGATKPLKPGQIVLLDTIGELASVYSLASVAFVGGSLVAAGGHNPLEPAQFAVPIVIGPNYANFRDITEYLRAHDAIRIAEAGEFADVLLDLLADGAAAQAMGERARQVFEQQSGATERCVQALRKLLGEEAMPVAATEPLTEVEEPVETRPELGRPLVVQAKAVSLDPPPKAAVVEAPLPAQVESEPVRAEAPLLAVSNLESEPAPEPLPEPEALPEPAPEPEAGHEPPQPEPVLVEPVAFAPVKAEPIPIAAAPEVVQEQAQQSEPVEAVSAVPESIQPFMPWLEMTRSQRMQEPPVQLEPLQAELAPPLPIQEEPVAALESWIERAEPEPVQQELVQAEPLAPEPDPEFVPAAEAELQAVEPQPMLEEPIEPEPGLGEPVELEPMAAALVAELLPTIEQAEPEREEVEPPAPETPVSEPVEPELVEIAPLPEPPAQPERESIPPTEEPPPPAPEPPPPVPEVEPPSVPAPVPPVRATSPSEPVTVSRDAKPGFATRKFLLPLVPLYRIGQSLREGRKGAKPAARLRHPVVSIGNLSTGGAGKTPLTIALAAALEGQGFHVDVLSRGFGRTAVHPIRVAPGGTVEEFGDEPLLIARATGIPVYVAAERYDAGLLAEGDAAAIAFLGEKLKPVIHLLDDGFQHRQLARAVDILLLDREDWTGTLLPAGNLREPVSAIQRAQIVAIPADDAGLERELRAGGWQGPVWKVKRRMSAPVVDGPVAAFCGIARPGQFFAGLEAAGVRLASQTKFPDHHAYTAKDLDKLLAAARTAGAVAMMTTEKDEVRLGGLLSGVSGALPLKTVALRTEILDIDEAIRSLTARLK